MSRKRAWLLFVLWATVGLAGQLLGAQALLFRGADVCLSEAVAMGVEGVERHRLVYVDLEQLRVIQPDGHPEAAPVLLLNLFDDVIVRAVLEEVAPTVSEGWLWLGSVDSPGGGKVVIVFDHQTIAGTVLLADRRFQIRNDGGPVHLIRERSPENSAELAAWSLTSNAGSELEMQVYHLTNEERQAHGLYLYAWSDTLGGVARSHALDMGRREFFSHVAPDGQGPADRITAAGYTWTACAENIAAGQTSAEAVMAAWMNSAGHRKNILRGYDDPDGIYFCDLGVGYAYVAGSPFGHYFTQKLARPSGVVTCPPPDGACFEDPSVQAAVRGGR